MSRIWILLFSLSLWPGVRAQTPQAVPSPAIEATPSASPEANPQATSSASVVPDSKAIEPIHAERAIYPLSAEEQRIQGQVLVKVEISETGNVDKAEIISGDSMLAQAALNAAKKWKFKPFIRNGKPVRVSTSLPFDFAFSDKVFDHPEKDKNVDTNPGGAVDAATPSSSSPSAGSSDRPKTVRVSAGVMNGRLVHSVAPVYPMDAKRLHITGAVILQARIGKDGRIAEMRAVAGPKELIPAAAGAVQQWRYKPYTLNGEPVEVDTQITVNFTLSP